MNNWTDSIFKRVWNVAIHVIGNFLSFVINTSAYQWADMSLHLLLLKIFNPYNNWKDIVVNCKLYL